MTEEEKYKPPKKGLGDVVHAGIHDVLSMIHIPANELLKLIWESPLEKRRSEWIENIGNGLRELEEKVDIKLNELPSNDRFIDAAMQATQAALRTHNRDKLTALRNAVLNSALHNSPDEAVQQIFLGFVDSFTEWHLRILSFLADPPEPWGIKFKPGFGYPVVHTNRIDNGLETMFPKLKDRKSFYNVIIRDLASKELLDLNASDASHHMATRAGIPSVKITELAYEFLQFIKSPLRDKD